MKSLLSVLLCCLIFPAYSQNICALKGKLVEYRDSCRIELKLPVIYRCVEGNGRLISVDKHGNWTTSVEIEQPLFADIEINNQSHTLLLIPGKELVINHDYKGEIRKLSGSAGEANRVVQQLDFDKPSFFDYNDSAGINPYASISPDSLDNLIITPWYQLRDEKVARINKTDLEQEIKQLLIDEVRYESFNKLNYYLRSIARLNRNNLIKFYKKLTDTLSPLPPVPVPGRQYHFFIENYIGYMEASAVNYFEKNKLTTKDTLPYFRISFDSGNVLMNEKGKLYLNWVAVKNNLPLKTAEAFIVQNLTELYYERDLKPFRALSDDFMRYFPGSAYSKKIKSYKKELEEILQSQTGNPDIIIWKDYEKTKSIYEVVKAFPGKVIYLDIWGTWCGPCKREIKYVPALKQYFAGKDVVFVYLDMDKDAKDQEWRDFIKLNKLTGVHLRKNAQEIVSFWKELLPESADQQYSYPSYFIFDKKGRLAVSEGYRPSDLAVLYKQIEAFLQ